MLLTCLKLLQTNFSKYATSFNMITNYFLWLLCCTIWKIDISIETASYLLWLSLSLLALASTQDMLLFCLFHSDQHSSSSGSKQIQLDIVTPILPTDFRVICRAIYRRYHSYYWSLWIIFQEQFSSVSSFLECHWLRLFLLSYYWLSLYGILDS